MDLYSYRMPFLIAKNYFRFMTLPTALNTFFVTFPIPETILPTSRFARSVT